ncbi:MAG: hypothetical protein K8T20_01245 [Planctomycetes bacterium]|nr:hypothetical protein [Planctomycetota bacterium]
MRRILSALTLFLLPALSALAQGVQMEGGWCAKHGNFERGYECPGCKRENSGAGGSGAGGGGNRISAEELARIRQQQAEAAERARLEREKQRVERERQNLEAGLDEARKQAPEAVKEEKQRAEAERRRRESQQLSDSILKDLFGARDGDSAVGNNDGLDFADGEGLFSKGDKGSAPVDASGQPAPGLAGSGEPHARWCRHHGRYVASTCPGCGEGALDFMDMPEKKPPAKPPVEVPAPNVVQPESGDLELLFGAGPVKRVGAPRTTWRPTVGEVDRSDPIAYSDMLVNSLIEMSGGDFPKLPTTAEDPEFWNTVDRAAVKFLKRDDLERMVAREDAFGKMDDFILQLRKNSVLAFGESWKTREGQDPAFHGWMDGRRKQVLEDLAAQIEQIKLRSRDEMKAVVEEQLAKPEK